MGRPRAANCHFKSEPIEAAQKKAAAFRAAANSLNVSANSEFERAGDEQLTSLDVVDAREG
ncbi:MAG TPA: hypothetical protein VLT91_13745, partial [Rhizomicrobium sp.]|nr:hypothetical protein [Rhizomicrobium sp.]